MNGFLNWKSRNISFTGNNLSYIIYMRTENIYSVYVHKNLKNGKYYVGSTSRKPSYRWNNGKGYQNNSKMWNDIQNSDWNKDWCHGILGKFDNKQDALNYEAFLIAMLGSIENGYNSSIYSSYGFTEETKRKLSELMTGRVFTEETRKKMAKAKGVNGILQFSKDGEFIAEYSSIMEAERQTGCNKGHICSCCKGKRKTCGGYIWRYAS